MQSENKKNIKLRGYVKPKLRTIELVAEEVLATGCKTGFSTGPAPPNCLAIGCAADGS